MFSNTLCEQAKQLASRLPELADNPDVLASEAHKLKGAAGYVGATRAAYFCGSWKTLRNRHTLNSIRELSLI